MIIKVLCENTSADNSIGCEHGLSLYIETLGKKILFDMGQTELFSINAEKMGVGLKDVDLAFLSHGHYDHGGGLETFLSINSKAKVYINENAFGDYYNGKEKYIGLNKALKENGRIIFTSDEYEVSTDMKLFSMNNKSKKFDLGSFGLNKKLNGEFYPDDFLHEHYLLINEKGKRILISGCSHKGIMDITEFFKPEVLIGGFHFSKLPLDGKLMEYALFLESTGTEFYTCHCTGLEQYEFMEKYMTKLNYIKSGQTIEI